MPSPFPCSHVTRECSWKKTQIEKKKSTNKLPHCFLKNGEWVLSTLIGDLCNLFLLDFSQIQVKLLKSTLSLENDP